jgi:hypothetical protein
MLVVELADFLAAMLASRNLSSWLALYQFGFPEIGIGLIPAIIVMANAEQITGKLRFPLVAVEHRVQRIPDFSKGPAALWAIRRLSSHGHGEFPQRPNVMNHSAPQKMSK